MAKVQTEIPGTERESIEAVDEAASEYLKARDEFNRWKKKKAEAQAHVEATLEDNAADIERDSGGALVYDFYDGEVEHEFVLQTKKKLKVHTKKAPDAQGTASAEAANDEQPSEDDIDDAYAEAFDDDDADDEYGLAEAEAALG